MSASGETTPYHAQYYAWELTKRCSAEKLEKLSQSFFNATVDMNPHQVDAALFAFRSPLSRGAILADEVGLGKTIEAGLIISQLWAERRRRILCILPASLRKQWYQELQDKFFIESVILEGGSYSRLAKADSRLPFDQSNNVILCSYQFARKMESEIRAIPWDLVVIDEAHRLRNVIRKDNKIARSIRDAIGNRPKVLLTATPLQNSLMELYGLVTFIDPHVFGSDDSFRSQFSRAASDMTASDYIDLRERLKPICQRTLRRQVTEYVRYTNRVSITQDFTPTDEELELYESVSAYLQRQESHALPAGQRSLMTLILRKILASSSFAIGDTLGAIIDRLEAKHRSVSGQGSFDLITALGEDFETIEEVKEEWQEDESAISEAGESGGLTEEEEQELILKAIRQELEELNTYRALAQRISMNAKGEALLVALKSGFTKAQELGAPQKALIFTESRRTQRYLKDLLTANGYGNQIVTFSGTNSDPDCRQIYERWFTRHKGTDKVTGSKTADTRSALVDEFREFASIMIATESGAEGINLQFCNLVVNYDLPWNPQRIEQRIGRCHRYGQQHDVVVINFLNRRNAADQRVFELLAEKFQLFDGVFGSSDDVLGVLETGADFEKRINEIYQTCRSPEEINRAFDKLQQELDDKIQARMTDARSKLLENFDDDVNRRLKFNRDKTAEQIGRFEEWLWKLTQHELEDNAVYSADSFSFTLQKLPEFAAGACVPEGNYRLVTQKNGVAEHHYRLGHPLAEKIIERAKSRRLPTREVVFDYGRLAGKISVVENLKGSSGFLSLSVLTISALETEDILLLSAVTDDGNTLDPDIAAKLLTVPGNCGDELSIPDRIGECLNFQRKTLEKAVLGQTEIRNSAYFEAEMEKLESWADDLKDHLERDLKELEKEIKVAKKEARQSTALDTKVELHKRAKDLEKKRGDLRRNLFIAQDDIDKKKEALISEIEGKLAQQLTVSDVFTIKWRVI